MLIDERTIPAFSGSQKVVYLHFTSRQILYLQSSAVKRVWPGSPHTRGVEPILFYCWLAVFDVVPTLKQHRLIVVYLNRVAVISEFLLHSTFVSRTHAEIHTITDLVVKFPNQCLVAMIRAWIDNISANMRHWPNVGLLMAHRLRRWPNSKQHWASVSCLVGFCLA